MPQRLSVGIEVGFYARVASYGGLAGTGNLHRIATRELVAIRLKDSFKVFVFPRHVHCIERFVENGTRCFVTIFANP